MIFIVSMTTERDSQTSIVLLMPLKLLNLLFLFFSLQTEHPVWCGRLNVSVGVFFCTVYHLWFFGGFNISMFVCFLSWATTFIIRPVFFLLCLGFCPGSWNVTKTNLLQTRRTRRLEERTWIWLLTKQPQH